MTGGHAFVAAFVALGALIPARGWRTSWLYIAFTLVFAIAPIVLLVQRDERRGGLRGARALGPAPPPATGHSLRQALATPTFWVFACCVSLYGLVSSGLGLFVESVLTERGLGADAKYDFYAYGLAASLAGQGLCAWLTLRHPLNRLLTAAMAVYAIALALLPLIAAMPMFYLFTALSGGAGGFIAVLFYAVWKPAFGTAESGRIQGAAQLLTVLFSASGPLVFALCQAHMGSYAPVLFTLAAAVALLAFAAWPLRLPRAP